MWEIQSAARRLGHVMVLALGAASVFPATAQAQDPYRYTYYNSQTITHGVYLPNATPPSGADEVRASDGTTCRSSMAGNGSYLDVGAIANPNATGEVGGASVYGRVMVPLGEKPRRLDCSKLYNLEVQRLQSEIEMLRMGANSAVAFSPGGGPGGDAWAREGWNRPSAARHGWQQGTTTTRD